MCHTFGIHPATIDQSIIVNNRTILNGGIIICPNPATIALRITLRIAVSNSKAIKLRKST
ncbi:MAG: hypothetical protein FWG79_09230 [Bacteroidales bacterium]|nr:hypothetical protein [Bacteroidales bacterium]